VTFTAPRGACDCHAHVFGPEDRFPYSPNRSYTPPERLPAAYGAMLKSIGVDRGVVVQPSVYGTDNRATLNAIAELGSSFRGVAVLPPDVDDSTLADHAAGGIRGVRLSGITPGGIGLEALEAMSARLKGSGWHIQLLANFTKERNLAGRIRKLGVPVVVDHFGVVAAGEGTAGAGFRDLLGLAREGLCWVKLSGLYLVSQQSTPFADVRPLAEALVSAAPERMLWATDWPHPASKDPVDDRRLLELFAEWVPDESVRTRILVGNPAMLYGFPA
jgi:predicted TIM-barrel fold metal-dependent hydrolase